MRYKTGDRCFVDVSQIDAWYVTEYGIEFHICGRASWDFWGFKHNEGWARKLIEILTDIDEGDNSFNKNDNSLSVK